MQYSNEKGIATLKRKGGKQKRITHFTGVSFNFNTRAHNVNLFKGLNFTKHKLKSLHKAQRIMLFHEYLKMLTRATNDTGTKILCAYAL